MVNETESLVGNQLYLISYEMDDRSTVKKNCTETNISKIIHQTIFPKGARVRNGGSDMHLFKKFKAPHKLNNQGASVSEYAILAGLIGIISIVAVISIGREITAAFSATTSTLQSANVANIGATYGGPSPAPSGPGVAFIAGAGSDGSGGTFVGVSESGNTGSNFGTITSDNTGYSIAGIYNWNDGGGMETIELVVHGNQSAALSSITFSCDGLFTLDASTSDYTNYLPGHDASIIYWTLGSEPLFQDGQTYTCQIL